MDGLIIAAVIVAVAILVVAVGAVAAAFFVLHKATKNL